MLEVSLVNYYLNRHQLDSQMSTKCSLNFHPEGQVRDCHRRYKASISLHTTSHLIKFSSALQHLNLSLHLFILRHIGKQLQIWAVASSSGGLPLPFPALLLPLHSGPKKIGRKSCQIFIHEYDILVLQELCSVSQQCCVFSFLPVSRVLLKTKGKPPPGPPVQQPRGLAGLFGQKQETPKLFKAMLGGKGKEGLAKLLQLKRQQDVQVMPQKLD